MKKFLLATTLIVAAGLSSVLLAAPAAGDRHERGMERMTEALSLTTEQQEQIRQIHEEEGAKLDAVLTAEQREKADAMHEERRERMEERREHRDDRPCDKK